MPAGKLVPMTAEEFNRRRRNRIARIVFPAVAAVLMVAVFTWRATKPAETQSYYAQGLEQYKNGKFYQAIAAFDRVIQERPDFRDAWRFRGMARAQVNQNTLARQDFDRVIQLAPGDVQAYQLRASALRSSANFQEAIRDYTRIVELRPASEVYVARAGCYRQLGKLEEALADLNRAIAMSPGVDTYMQQGQTLEQLKDFPQALQSYSKAIELRPEDPFAYRSRAFAKEKSGDAAGARADRAKADALERPTQQPQSK